MQTASLFQDGGHIFSYMQDGLRKIPSLSLPARTPICAEGDHQLTLPCPKEDTFSDVCEKPNESAVASNLGDKPVGKPCLSMISYCQKTEMFVSSWDDTQTKVPTLNRLRNAEKAHPEIDLRGASPFHGFDTNRLP